MDPIVELKDRFGNTMFFGYGGGVRFAASSLIPDFRKQLEEVRNLELRHDDVIVAGYPKSGNHWHQQIIRMLQQNNTDYQPNTATTEVLEYFPKSYRKPAANGPRVFFSHLCLRHLPKQLLEKKVKVIHLTRNPKDTFVSLYSQLRDMCNKMHYGGTWDQFFHVMLEWGFWHGDYFDHLFDWEREIEAHPDQPVFVSNYEDMVKDTVGQIERLAQFLGLERGPSLYRAIADTCCVDNMRSLEEETLRSLPQAFSQQCAGIYRKGKVGDWKNFFTVEQNELFDKVYNYRMADSSRTFVFE